MDYHLLTEFLAWPMWFVTIGWSIYLLTAQTIDWDPASLIPGGVNTTPRESKKEPEPAPSP